MLGYCRANGLPTDLCMALMNDSALLEIESSGFIKEVGSSSPALSSSLSPVQTGPVFYLPHPSVIKQSSTSNRIWPVFDASAKGLNGIALNNYIGPSLNPNLVDVLH